LESRIPLPPAFLKRMAHLLEGEYEAFLASYGRPPCGGLRVNTLKIPSAEFLALAPWSLERVPWCATGFTLPDDHRAGRHPFHAAGLYYLQEPSAMAVGEVLGAQPGERVLDLCAAPGGKATHLAAQLGGQGVLVANEVHRRRARTLAENLERCGVTNAIVTSETPERLASHWPGLFDRVLVDAPCSGEGMFRKSEVARREWGPKHVAGCALRQERILHQAALMVRPSGTLAYATCTFAPEENEGVIVRFLRAHPDFEIVAAPAFPGFAPGRPGWVANAEPLPGGIDWTVRLWPHHSPGEGHFIALLRRHGPEASSPRLARRRALPTNAARLYRGFCAENLHPLPCGAPALFGKSLYHVPEASPDLAGLRVTCPGWLLGTLRKGRIEPSHALALGITCSDALRVLDLSPEDDRVLRYLCGEVLNAPGEPGWV